MFFTSARCRRLLLGATLLLGAATTHAQRLRPTDDFVVTSTGDTLRGRIRLKGRSAAMLRLYQPQQAPVTFTASQVRSYGTNHTLLKVSRPVGPHGKRLFLIPLVRGYMSLYAGKDTADQVRYYLQPQDTTYVVEAAPTTAVLTYARLFSSCPSLEIGSNAFMQRYNYGRSGLMALVTDYNHCRQQPSEIVEPPSGVRTMLGVKIGVGFLHFNPGPGDSYAQLVYGPGPSQSLAIQAGVVALFATRSNLSIQLEGNYLYFSSTYPPPSQAAYGTGTYFGLYGVKLQYSQFQVPVLIHYAFGRGSFAPYLNLGPSIGANFGNNSKKQVYNITGTTLTDQSYSTNISTISLGGAAGAGLYLHKAGLPALLLEARYDFMVDNINDRINHRSLRIEAGVLF